MKKRFLFSIPLVFLLFTGCSSEKKEEVKEVANTTIDKVAEATNTTAQKVTETIEEVKKEATPIVNEVVEKSKEVVKSSQKVVEDVAKEAEPMINDAVKSSQKVVENVTNSVTDMTQSIQKTIQDATTPSPSIDGKPLYTRCGSCHGQSGEKKALNTSAVIQGWSKSEILKALKGYKDGSYGGAMKGVMLGQVKNLSDAELDALAAYISTL